MSSKDPQRSIGATNSTRRPEKKIAWLTCIAKQKFVKQLLISYYYEQGALGPNEATRIREAHGVSGVSQ